jgi:N-glycosidase YbiA
MKTIYFYRPKEPFGEFSNFAPYPIELKGRIWPTSEHYFQAQKFAGTDEEEAIRSGKSPMIAARMGRSRQRPLRKDWEDMKDDIMREALRAKFTQHPRLKSLLLETGEAVLVEHTKNDCYWADGGDGTGKNKLGQLLMMLRTQLRSNA